MLKVMQSTVKKLAWLCAGLLLMSFAGCWQAKEHVGREGPALEAVAESEWPQLLDDLDSESLNQAAAESLAYLEKVPGKSFTFGTRKVRAAEMAWGIKRFLQLYAYYPNTDHLAQVLKKEFVLYRSVGSDGEGKVLYTGYYEPVMDARKSAQGSYLHPLYAVPQDLVTIDLRLFSEDLPRKRLVGRVSEQKVVPYHDREAIDYDNAIDNRAQILAYLSDPVEAFFLHIQGSGQVLFSDGTRLRLGYAGTNGRPYRSIGRYLIDQGLMEYEGMSMQGIRAFLERHPEKRRRVLSQNPSYVFFRPLSAEGGPLGCFEIPLAGGRSIATDRRIFPGLALAYISGIQPGPDGGQAPLNRFVFNQDTGGAIRGPGRLDLFYGSGKEAGELAGRMKYEGRLYFLAPKPGMVN